MLRLEFNSAAFPACRHTYDVTIDGQEHECRLFRVAVWNWSPSQSVEEVRILCEGIYPLGVLLPLSSLPLALRAMHDRSRNWVESQHGVTVHPGERRFFDVVAKLLKPGQPPWICAALKDCSVSLPTARTELVLGLYGRNVPHANQRYVLEEDEGGELLFYEYEKAPGAPAQVG